MSDGKVTALFGGDIVAANPSENVVIFLERLLDRARAGEITSIAVAFVCGNGIPCEGWDKRPADSFVLHSGIACLLGQYTDDMNSTYREMGSLPEEPA